MPKPPSAAEIQAVGEVLAQYWPGARAELKLYLDGRAPWAGALRQIRIILQQVIRDTNRGPKIPVRKRRDLAVFAATYGTETHGVLGSAPLEVQKTMRFTKEEWDAIEAAAKNRGITVTQFVRNASYMEALKEMEQP